MAQFFAFFKTIREIISIYKEIKKYFNKVYIRKLEEEQTKRSAAGRKTTDAIEADQSKPVSQQSNEDLIQAHRDRNS